MHLAVKARRGDTEVSLDVEAAARDFEVDLEGEGRTRVDAEVARGEREHHVERLVVVDEGELGSLDLDLANVMAGRASRRPGGGFRSAFARGLGADRALAGGELASDADFRALDPHRAEADLTLIEAEVSQRELGERKSDLALALVEQLQKDLAHPERVQHKGPRFVRVPVGCFGVFRLG